MDFKQEFCFPENEINYKPYLILKRNFNKNQINLIHTPMIKKFAPKFLTPETFDDFTFSKKKHFDMFIENNFDEELFGYLVDPLNCDLKIYQDLFIYSFMKFNVPKGSKILDIGGGDSRILKYFKDDYECWNIDKLEGVGNGPTDIDTSGFRLVYDYMGNFNKELPDDYFDVVFSISTLEHVPLDDVETYENIRKDINRVLKPGGLSLHCIDIVWLEPIVWTNAIMPYFFEKEKMIFSAKVMIGLVAAIVMMTKTKTGSLKFKDSK